MAQLLLLSKFKFEIQNLRAFVELNMNENNVATL